jgi:hypothetical protein
LQVFQYRQLLYLFPALYQAFNSHLYMSSTLSPRHESSSRNWWQLSSRHSTSSVKSDKDTQKQSGVKFNTLASAIGFKTKKHPSLTIQDPPLPTKHVESPVTDRQELPRYANRPPSKSVSSTVRSSVELRTPSDAPRDPLAFRRSLLTLSDDPFASGGISVPAIQDPAHLCMYSTPDDMPKKQPSVEAVVNIVNSSCASWTNDSWPHTPIPSPSGVSHHGPLLKCVSHHGVH